MSLRVGVIGCGAIARRQHIPPLHAAGAEVTAFASGHRGTAEAAAEEAGGGAVCQDWPGEAFHALGRAVEQVRDDRTLLAGLAPTWQVYLPLPFTKGYEEKMSYSRGFVRRVGELLTTAP